MMINHKEWYNSELKKAQALKSKTIKQRKIVSWIRLTTFMAGVVALYFFVAAGNSTFVVISVVATVTLFLFLLKWFSVLRRRSNFYIERVGILERELAAVNGDYSGFDGAKEFQDTEHEYSEDIDLFGDESVFQLLNRTSTVGGLDKLSGWCMHPKTDIQKLKERQNAVKELLGKPEFRVLLETLGRLAGMEKSDLKKLQMWNNLPHIFSKKVFSVLTVIFISLSLSGIVLVITDVIPFSLFLLYVIVGPLFVTGIFLKQINVRHNYLSRSAELFGRYSELFHLVSATEFENEHLRRLKERVGNEDGAPEALKKLGRIVASTDSRLNMLMGIILNALFLWDIIQMARLERWQKRYGDDITEWFDAVASFDALCSLSTFAYNMPHFVIPEFSDTHSPVIKIENGGHPLIPHSDRVGNDFELNSRGQFVIVTGANMAGKSTFLRTVGVNMVLAMAGTVVCADRMIMTPLQLITSLRTTDNLVRNESYFFAELKRLKWIIDRLNRGEKLFIILDEILKGTNSKDKQEGSKALIEQFVRLKATGIIATHDIILGKLSEIYPKNVVNRCFEVSLKDDTLGFDYKLRDGISQNMNATFLMKKMGITL